MATKILSGTLLDEKMYLSLTEISDACSSRTEWVVELVEEGILEPAGTQRDAWRFPGNSLTRAHIAMRLQQDLLAMRLQQDLHINLAGVALALDLLDEIDMLKTRQANIEQ